VPCLQASGNPHMPRHAIKHPNSTTQSHCCLSRF
jgi:hypothetical protein